VRKNPIEEKARDLYRSGRYASIGLELGVSVVLGMLLGRWVDGQLETQPWGLLIGLGLGFTAAVRSISRTLAMLAEENETADRETNDD
jgi:F0F1-type ATP synthase assembly protein I